ncbi:hypothetical protein MASR2M15_03940 [Anaerolineales bacterium]
MTYPLAIAGLEFLTPELFDILIILVMIIGFILAGIRLAKDLKRPPAQNIKDLLYMDDE